MAGEVSENLFKSALRCDFFFLFLFKEECTVTIRYRPVFLGLEIRPGELKAFSEFLPRADAGDRPPPIP